MLQTAPNMKATVESLAGNHPKEFRDCHRPELGEKRATAFIRIVATELYRVNSKFGLNGKRGGNLISMDAVSYLNPYGPGGVEIYDVVKAAGSDAAQPAWIDVTQQTIDANTVGKWIHPLESVEPLPPVTIFRDHAYYRKRLQAIEDIYQKELHRSLGFGTALDVEGISLRMFQIIEARWSDDLIRDDVRKSQEWADKHPGETP